MVGLGKQEDEVASFLIWTRCALNSEIFLRENEKIDI